LIVGGGFDRGDVLALVASPREGGRPRGRHAPRLPARPIRATSSVRTAGASVARGTTPTPRACTGGRADVVAARGASGVTAPRTGARHPCGPQVV
jgi:hypothetical protein